MNESLQKKYLWISEEIDKSNNQRMHELLSSLSIFKNKGERSSSSNSADAGKKHDVQSMAFLCLRVKYAIQLVCAGQTRYEKSIKNDIKDIIKIICSLEHEHNTSDTVAFHAKTLISALLPDKQESVSNTVYRLSGAKPLNSIQLSPNLGRLFSSMVKVYLSMGLTEEYTALLDFECLFSRTYSNSISHRKLVAAMLFFLCENDLNAAIHIAEKEAECFEDSVDGETYQFYWYYGTALVAIGRAMEAEELFKKCYFIMRDIRGDDNWYTLMSKREYVWLAFMREHKETDRDWLISFVDYIEKDVYPEDEKHLAKQTEGKTLYCLLFEHIDRYSVEQYDRLLCLYEDICEQYNSSNEPLLKKRLSCNFRGGFYLYVGDYINAERAFHEAINSELPDGVPEIISIPQVKSNLLMAYLAQQDFELLDRLLEELMDIIDSDDAKGLSEKDKFRIYNILISRLVWLTHDEINAEFLDEIKRLLFECCKDVASESNGLPDCRAAMTAFMVNAALFFVERGLADTAEQRLFFNALTVAESMHIEYAPDPVQKAVLYFALSSIAWNLTDDNTAFFMKKMLEASEHAELHFSIFCGIFISEAGYSLATGEKTAAMEHARKALDRLDETWKQCVRYLNDDRLIQILLPAQFQFSLIYSLMRKNNDSEFLYEKILQFKAIASLAGKERNRVIHSTLQVNPLIGRIRDAQNRIAVLETEAYFRNNSIVIESERAELRDLEAQFADAFPNYSSFTKLTWKNVSEALPDNAVVIEYFLCKDRFAELPINERLRQTDSVIDIFITTKRHGKSTLTRIEVPVDDIVSVSDEFVAILQLKSDDDKASVEQNRKINDLRDFLYSKLIAPVLPYLEGFSNVYIAPDMGFINLPIDLLYDYETQTSLADEYNVIMIECARDFLFRSTGGAVSEGSLIIADPQYDLDDKAFNGRKNDKHKKDRSTRMDSKPIERLPFSLIEAQRISSYLNSKCFTGAMAKKTLMNHAGNNRIIHIATHGYYDASEMATGMYSSCLLFAGAGNWIREGNISDAYGNGLLTADEVSRMDLKGVELVVLSSCMSGMSDVIINKGFCGMIGAFSAAGVHYVVSHLWSANDFSTAVLMCQFYQYYIKDRLEPPVALATAKDYLRNVTVGSLKKDGWFGRAMQLDLSKKTHNYISNCESKGDDHKPFKDEIYWGGFTCYQCY